ncbi:nucleotide exchange factor GrpE [Tumidithrix elongata RA019]|uniref:Protein GrpE n=1 Tax=Tumidithrix elongata BACA0141 TaxID=2716417 RepID=A0AAW9PYK5_9CYAN|nr:nucleotide exchange factor GrpE [Tumidithrix elongata RA019]
MRDAFESKTESSKDKDPNSQTFEQALMQSGYATAEQIQQALQIGREKRMLFVYALEMVIGRSLPRELVKLYMQSRSQTNSIFAAKVYPFPNSKTNSTVEFVRGSDVNLETISSGNAETTDRIFVGSESPELSLSAGLSQNPSPSFSQTEKPTMMREEFVIEASTGLEPSLQPYDLNSVRDHYNGLQKPQNGQESYEATKGFVNSTIASPTEPIDRPIEDLIALIRKWATGEVKPESHPFPNSEIAVWETKMQNTLKELAEVRDRLAQTQEEANQKQLERDRLSEQLLKLKQELSKRDRQLASLSSKHEQELTKKEQQLNSIFQELLQVRAELIGSEPEVGTQEKTNPQAAQKSSYDSASNSTANSTPAANPPTNQIQNQEHLQAQLTQKEEQVKAEIFKRLLVTLDIFDLAIHQVKPQTEREQMIHTSYQRLREKLMQDLKQFGVSAMETTGQIFDPTFHEAVIAQPTDRYPEGTIMTEIRRGYLFQSKVLRYAQVKVAVSNQ